MALHTLKFLVLLGLLLLGAGCRLSQPQRTTEAVKCPTPEDVATRDVVVVLVERPGSVHESEMTQIRTDFVDLVERLPAATQLYMADNASSGDVWRRDAIPAEPEPVDCKSTNPFDYAAKQACQRQRRHYEARRACVALARQRIIATLQQLSPVPAPRPAVYGTLAAVATMFAAYPSSGRWLIVYSALDETVPRQILKPLEPFKGAKVLVRMPRPALGEQGPQRLAAFKQRLCGWGAQVAVPPFEMPWPAVFQHADDLFAAAVPVVDPPTTALAAFMATLARGPYGVIVASHATEAAARQEVHQIHATYPELWPSHGPSVDGKLWAVSLGAFYTRDAAEALKAKAKALGLRHDTFVWHTRRY